MITEKPLVSIALCTFNGEKYIVEQLVSILNQTYQALEIIIVDDCSTDKTYSILEEFAKKDHRIKLNRNPDNLGFNANFSKAITLASGAYIAIADQDDIWLPEKIYTLLHAIQDNLLIYHDSEYIDASGKSIGKSTTSHHRFVKGFCYKNLLYYNCASGHTMLFKKELLSKTPDFPKDFYYDWWMAYTAACLGKIDFIQNKLVKHRIHLESSTQNDHADARLTRLYNLSLFVNHPLCPPTLSSFIHQLMDGYKELKYRSFSLKLFLLLIANFHQLFLIRKKTVFSKIKFAVKECSR